MVLLFMVSLCAGSLPVDQRRGYSNVFNALVRITKEEGVTTLWRVNTYTDLFRTLPPSKVS